MLGNVFPGALVSTSGISSTQAANASNYFSAPQVMTTNTTLTAAQSGATFINQGAAGAVTLTIPLGLPIGTEFTLCETDAQNFGVTCQTGELIQVSTAATQLTCGAIAKGSTFRVKKVESNLYFLMSFVGSVG